jgi:hypothetical protein
MTTITVPNTDSAVTARDIPARTGRSLVTVGLAAGVGATVINLLAAAAARGLNVSLKVSGFGSASPQPIPLAGFASMTMLGTVLGVAMAAAAARWARRPASRFLTLAMALTALSLVPGAMGAADGATLVVLVITHVTAAAIIVTTLAARLRRRTQ